MTRASDLEQARREATRCRRCDLWRNATQVVFGEGTTRARAMLVGEQPGDVEDEAGRPFVGPAGMLLRKVLAEVGLDEHELYLTNAVKHFKWRPKGTRRIHDKPSWSEVQACAHWLQLELAHVRPELLVCLGATAAQAVLGKGARVNALRGSVVEAPDVGVPVVVTVHPSAVLRAGNRREERRRDLVSDLALVRAHLGARLRPRSTAPGERRRRPRAGSGPSAPRSRRGSAG